MNVKNNDKPQRRRSRTSLPRIVHCFTVWPAGGSELETVANPGSVSDTQKDYTQCLVGGQKPFLGLW